MLRSEILVYDLIRYVSRFLFGTIIGWRVIGLEKVPLNETVVFVMNHAHRLDSIAVLSSFPVRAVPLVSTDTFRRHRVVSSLVSLIGRAAGGIAVDRRGGLNLNTVRTTLQKMRAGVSIMVMPEGTRSYGGQLHPLHDGAGYLALLTGARVVPVVTFGYAEALRLHFGRSKRITIVVGDPFEIPKAGSRGRGCREMATKEISERMGALVDEYVPNRVPAAPPLLVH